MPDLEVRRLGRTEMKPKALGLGCGHLGDAKQPDQDGIAPPSLIGGSEDPTVAPRAHQMWQWCKKQNLNIRDLAMQFALNAPVDGNGMVLAGPANQKELDEVYASATTKVPETVWQDFEAAFGIRI